MKTLVGFTMALLFAWSALGDGMTSVEIDGTRYSNVTKAYMTSSGKVVILFPGGGTSATVDKLPTDFLKSWNIKAEGAMAAAAKDAARELDQEIQMGYFREIAGVVYNIRSPQSGWVTIRRAKVIQILDSGAILDASPEARETYAIHVKHLSASVGDTDTITFTAKQVGSYSYINKLGDDRTIREYDLGHVCERDEIPKSVLTGEKAFDVVAVGKAENRDMLASLPESGDLKASGSGFFITDDGYLVSNNHVVKNAAKVRLLTGAGTIDAEVVQTDSANDLALLKARGKFACLPIASSRAARLGETVITVGFPNVVLQGFSPKLAKGEIASLTGIQDNPRYFQISVPVQPGNSGGALVDDHGNVIGIVSAKLNASAALASSGALPENVNYAVKSSLLMSFLESVPELSTKLKPAVTAQRPFEDTVKSAQDAAVLVLVY